MSQFTYFCTCKQATFCQHQLSFLRINKVLVTNNKPIKAAISDSSNTDLLITLYVYMYAVLCCIKLDSETHISESEVGVLAEFPSFPLGNTTFPTSVNDISCLETCKYKFVNTSLRAQWNAELVNNIVRR